MDKRAHDLQCYSRVRFEEAIRIQYWGSNIIGVTALPVMRPFLNVAQGRQVRRSVLCPSCSSSLRYESGRATPYAKLLVEGVPLFWFLFGAYGLSIGTVLGFVKSRVRAGAA